MAFNNEELQIIRAGVEAGKTRPEVEAALAKYRTGFRPETTENIKSPIGPEILKGMAKGAGQTIKVAGDLAAKTLPALAGPIANIPAVKEGIEGAKSAIQGAVGLTNENLSAENPAQMAGKGIEFALEVFTPLAATKIPTVTKALISGVDELAESASTKIAGATPKVLDASSIVQRINRITPTKQSEFQRMTGSPVGQWLVDRGIVDTTDRTVLALQKRMQQSMGQVDAALAGRPETFQSPIFLKPLKDLAAKAERVSVPGAKAPYAERVNELTKKLQGEGLTLEEINEVKRLFERNVKLDFVKENKPESVELANNVDSALRNFIFDKSRELGIANIDELNKETQAARFLIDEIGRASAGRAANNAITLTDWLLLAEGAADPVALAAFLGKKGLSAETFQAWLAQKIAPEASVALPKAKISDPKPGIREFNQKNK